MITVAAGQPIRSTHVNQFTRWITGQTKDLSFTPVTTSASDYTATVTNEDTSAGLMLKGVFGNTTAFTFNKTGATFNVPLFASNPLAGLFSATGQTIYGSGGTGSSVLNIGSTFQSLLVSTAGIPFWASSPTSILTAQADLLGASAANTLARIPKGTAFQEFMMNAGATGQTYVTGFIGSVQTTGDLIYGGGANTAARLAAGANGTFLTLSGGTLAWGSPAAAAQSVQSPVINGDFNIWQDGTSFSTIASGIYSADMWQYQSVVGTGVIGVTRSTDVPAVASSVPLQSYSLLADCKTTEATFGATETVLFVQGIEGANWLPFAQRTFTLSFWVKATKVGVYCVSFRNAGADRSYVAEYTVASSATWEQKSVTVSPSPAAGTWDYATGAGVYMSFSLGGGSSFQATAANVWTSANLTATANQVNALDNTANDWRLAMVQMDLGTSASQFAPIAAAQSMERCERYYQIGGAGSAGRWVSATGVQLGYAARTTMRTSPVLAATTTGPSMLEIGVNIRTGSGSVVASTQAATIHGAVYQITGFSGGTNGNGALALDDHVGLSARF